MSIRHTLSILVITVNCAVIIACGGGATGTKGSVQEVTTPSGPPAQNSLLSGTYSFAISDKGCTCPFSFAGSLHADGSGNIDSGVMDFNRNNVVQTAVPVTGTYRVGTDHRGTANLNASGTPLSLRFVVINSKRAFIIGFDTHQNASGSMELQDPSSFSNGSLAGSFTFRLFGVDGVGEPIQMAGIFGLDGSGGLSSGIEDLHDNDVIETELRLQPGAFSLGPSNGRGTATITTQARSTKLAFYVVDVNHLQLIALDAAPVMIGDAFRQAATPALNGPYAFTAFGWSSATPKPFGAGGVFIADGNGSITSGIEDTNINNAISRNLALTGSYALKPNGRSTMAFNTSAGSTTFAAYPSMAGVQLIEIDSNLVTGGMAFPQQGGPFSLASLNGGFGFSAAGFSGDNSDVLAVFSSDGKGNLSGTVDLNTVGAPQDGLPLTGTYSISGNSGTATLKSSNNTSNIALYPVSNSHALTLSLDNNSVMIGSIEQ